MRVRRLGLHAELPIIKVIIYRDAKHVGCIGVVQVFKRNAREALARRQFQNN